MSTEFLDFQTAWEQRFIEVISDGIEPAPEFAEGSRRAEFADGSTLSVSVNMGEEEPPASGWYSCEVEMFYSFDPAETAEGVSNVWNQIEEMSGDGPYGDSPLRSRLPDGRLSVPGGMNSVTYDGAVEVEPGSRTLNFSAVLGIQSPN
jgi:hypothetical protein